MRYQVYGKNHRVDSWREIVERKTVCEMPAMHVLGISSNWPGQRGPFGDIFFKRCLCGLARRGHQVTVLAPRAIFRGKKVSGGGNIKFRQPVYASFSSVNVPFFGNTARLGEYFKTIVCLRDSQKFFLGGCKPEIVYAKFFQSAGVARRVAQFHGISWVVSIGESVWDHEEKLIPTFGHSKIREVLKDADGIETVSNELKGYLHKRFEVNLEKINVIPNGVDTAEFKVREQVEALKYLGLRSGKFLVCFIGSDTPNKGARRVLKAVHWLHEEGLDDITLLLLGATEALAGERGVEFAGKVAPREIPWYMAASDIFVLPTTNEGMCNSIIEAMAVGLPVVSSDLPFNRELLSQKTGILVDPLDVEAIASAIRRLRQDGELRRRMSVAGRQQAELMNIQDRVKKVEQMLVSIVQ